MQRDLRGECLSSVLAPAQIRDVPVLVGGHDEIVRSKIAELQCPTVRSAGESDRTGVSGVRDLWKDQRAKNGEDQRSRYDRI